MNAASSPNLLNVTTARIHSFLIGDAFHRGFPGGTSTSGKESTCQRRRCGFDSWVRKMPGSRKWHTSLIILLGKFLGQRSLVGFFHGATKS